MLISDIDRRIVVTNAAIACMRKGIKENVCREDVKTVLKNQNTMFRALRTLVQAHEARELDRKNIVIPENVKLTYNELDLMDGGQVYKDEPDKLTFSPEIRKEARGEDKEDNIDVIANPNTFDMDAQIKETVEKAKNTTDAEMKKRQSIVYPNWSNLDAGKMAIFKTDKFPFYRFQVENESYPGIYIGDIVAFRDELTAIIIKEKQENKEERKA